MSPEKSTKPAATKPAAKKPAAKKPAAKKPAAKKPAAKKPAAKKAPATKPARPPAPARKMAPRADFGAPVDAWFAKQPEPQRTIVAALRALVAEAAPEAEGSLKWGMPFYTVGGGMMCAITSHKAHVNLVLSGPDELFVDPDGRLEGTGKTGRHLTLRAPAELPKAAVQRWLKAAAANARKTGKMR